MGSRSSKQEAIVAQWTWFDFVVVIDLTERVEVKLSEFEGFARFFQTETNPNALRFILAMSFENIVARAELEWHGYHELSEEQLRLKDDPEALLQRGIRLWLGIAVRVDVDSGWELIITSAKLGHPVALALCFLSGKGTQKNVQHGIELLSDSASRGHAFGK